MGLGGTYHFWGTTDGVVLPFTVSWSENRYEVGVFRMSTRQTLDGDHSHEPRMLAAPYWGVSASRRWNVMDRGPVRAFVGFGLAVRSASDILSATRWDFASQLGLRWRLPLTGAAVELTLRHWSNGGIELPNHGQDFATLTFQFDSRRFATDRFVQTRNLRLRYGGDDDRLRP